MPLYEAVHLWQSALFPLRSYAFCYQQERGVSFCTTLFSLLKSMPDEERKINMKKVAIIMGSDSDLPVLKPAFEQLRKLDIPFEAHVYSAHRTPVEAAEFARNARDNGFGVLIAAAGKAAHLAGALAAQTTLPIIGIPVKSSTLDGLDALLSTVQMPSGMPVATVAIDGAANAALLAAQMIAIEDADLAAKLNAQRKAQHDAVIAKNDALVID